MKPQGSPPLARGKAQKGVELLLLKGITPACAGKRRTPAQWKMGWWDHPRLRGEKSTSNMAHLLSLGSPPLARGKELYNDGTPVQVGITPACAGKSTEAYSKTKRAGGSPPLARGKDVLKL